MAGPLNLLSLLSYIQFSLSTLSSFEGMCRWSKIPVRRDRRVGCDEIIMFMLKVSQGWVLVELHNH